MSITTNAGLWVRIVFLSLLMTTCNLAMGDGRQNTKASQSVNSTGGFSFARIRYRSTGGFQQSWYRYEGRDWQRWETDYPRAEQNLLYRLNELTSIDVNADPTVVNLTDSALFDFPFIFMSDIGWQLLTTQEQASLSKYLQRGGFLWVDDFWGDAELASLYKNLGDLHVDWRWKKIPIHHPIMSTVFDVDESPQIPARIFYTMTGLDYDPPEFHKEPTGGIAGMQGVNFLGLFDKSDRLLAVATHNTDIADGWEREGESQAFFHRFSVSSYFISINIISYLLSH